MATEALILRLRRAVDERIPAGGSDTDTAYTDAELDAYLDEVDGNLNLAAANIWLEKATALSPDGSIQSYSVAGESYSFASKREAYDHAMAMHKLYLSRVAPTLFLEGTPSPAVDDEPVRYGDISRLTQDRVGW
ncbi:hypothetical protein [Weizmannia phage Youna2]